MCVPKFYNALPEEIHAMLSCEKFIRVLKKYVYAKKLYSAEEYFESVNEL